MCPHRSHILNETAVVKWPVFFPFAQDELQAVDISVDIIMCKLHDTCVVCVMKWL